MLLRDVGGVTCHDENVAVVPSSFGGEKKTLPFSGTKTGRADPSVYEKV